MDMKTCINQCRACEQVCLETLAHCLQQGGKHGEAVLINALLDCIQLCGSCADLMTRNSPLHAEHCLLCAEACRRCAEACEAVGGSEMKRWPAGPVNAAAARCTIIAKSCRRGPVMRASPDYSNRRLS